MCSSDHQTWGQEHGMGEVECERPVRSPGPQLPGHDRQKGKSTSPSIPAPPPLHTHTPSLNAALPLTGPQSPWHDAFLLSRNASGTPPGTRPNNGSLCHTCASFSSPDSLTPSPQALEIIGRKSLSLGKRRKSL